MPTAPAQAPLWHNADIAAATKGSTAGSWHASGLSIDSRTVQPGDLFIALQGPHFDGHHFVAAALAKGAVAALVHQPVAGIPAEQQLLVPDTFAALQALGEAGRARAQAKIIAITGSVGKTGCKEALARICADQAPSFATRGSFNNHWGVPLSLATLPAAAAYGVFELGMNHAGELTPLSQAVQPHIALITTIAPVHIGNFASLDEIAAAKAEIFAGVLPGGCAVLPADNAYAAYLAQRAGDYGIKNLYWFGTSPKADAPKADAIAEKVVLHAGYSQFTARICGETIPVTLGVPGAHWVQNALAVLLTARLAGLNLAQAGQSLAQLSPAPGRGVRHSIALPQNQGSFTVIDESYNASPVAVEMAIQVLAHQPGRKILVLGDMREMGRFARDAHLALAETITAHKIDKVFCCGELMQHLYHALPAHIQAGTAPTSHALAPLVAAAIKPGDVITVKGSHSMQMEQVVQALQGLAAGVV